jgi:D-3-phosphoglycerate dehydrogenase
MAHRVLLSDSLGPEGLARLQEQPDLHVDYKPGLAPDELCRIIGDYDGLVVRSGTKVTAGVIAHAAKLRVIGRAGIGVDNIDVEAATARGIVVMNTPGGSNVTTAEHTIAMLLALARSIPQAAAAVRAGEWPRSRWLGTEVCNKVLGIVGLGNIGAIVAERALGLRMKVIAFDPFATPETAARLRVELVALDDLYRRADFVSIHTPLTAETRGLIGRAAMARMKPGVRIVNCARGGIVDEQALREAIESGHVAGAALDVLETEPAPPNHPLLALDTVICTPHLGASTGEAQVNVAVAIAQQVAEFLTKGTIQGAVNAPSLSPEVLQVLRPFLGLAEKLGLLAAQLNPEIPSSIELRVRGDVAEREMGALSTAVLRGFLDRVLGVDVGYSVNYVNAPGLARDRGIRVVEETSDDTVGYRDAIDLRIVAPSRTLKLQGAVFGGSTVRLTRIDDFFMEAVPDGYILMLHNRDVPGVVGNVGTLLGQNRINIAGVELGRENVGGMAISLFHVDEAVSDDVLAQLRTLPHVVSANLLEL